MSDIEKRALIQQLETNAVAYELLGEKELPKLLRRAAAALTPPEGYVLVPVEPTWEMNMAGENSVRLDVDPKRKPHPETARRAARNSYVEMLAARPEVSGG